MAMRSLPLTGSGMHVTDVEPSLPHSSKEGTGGPGEDESREGGPGGSGPPTGGPADESRTGGLMEFVVFVYGDEEAEEALTPEDRRAIFEQHVALGRRLEEAGVLRRG